MCEQTPIHYKHGDIVWVKLDLSWWPGQVIDFEALPPDLQESFTSGRKKPLVVVSFFQEENYEYVMNLNTIYSYNCTRKDDFIRRAMDLIRAKNTLMDKFPSDIQIAEEMTGGNVDILKDPKYGPQKKRTSFASMIFGSAKKKESPARPKGRPKQSEKPFKPNVTHRRFTGLCDDYEVRLLVQTSIPESPVQQSKYSCDRCDFESSRIDVIVLHNKTHAYDIHPHSTPRPSLSSRRPLKKFKIPASRTSTIEEDLALLEQGISLTDNESSSYEEEEEIEIVKPKVKRKQKVTEKRKGKKAKVSKPAKEDTKKDIRVDLLAEWDDDDEEEDENTTINNNQSMDSASTSFADTPTKPSTSPTPEKTKIEDKSCFDFKEEEENHILTATTSSGRKIPRVIPEKRKSIEPGTSNTEDVFEAELNRFAEVLESTTAPELPSSLKCEQNFHYTKAIKFPDKCEEESPKAESTPKLINIKKRFVKSFNDFEHSLRIEQDKEESKKLNKKILTVDNFEDGNEKDNLKTGLSEDAKSTGKSTSSINDEDIPLTLKDAVEDSIGMDIDFQFEPMSDSLRLDREVTDNLSPLKIPDNLQEVNKLTEKMDNRNQKTIAESQLEAKNESKTNSHITEYTPNTKTNNETKPTNVSIDATKNNTESILDNEIIVQKNTDMPATGAISVKLNTTIAKENDSIEDIKQIVVSKTNTESMVDSKIDSQIETLVATKTDESNIIIQNTTDVNTKIEPMVSTNIDSEIEKSPKESKKKDAHIDDPKSSETKTRRRHEEDHLPIKKSRYSRKPFYEESKKTRTKKVSASESLEDETKASLPTRPANIDSNQKTTRTERPSFSLDDDDGLKKLMSKLPSFSGGQSSTASYSLDCEENLKTSRWDQRPSEAGKKMQQSESSFSANFDEYLKKNKTAQSSLDADDNSKNNISKSPDSGDGQKTSRSTRSTISREIEEDIKKKSSPVSTTDDLKKTRSKRSSITTQGDKKSGSSRSSFASIFEEDLKKRRSPRTSLHDTDELKKKSRPSPTADIEEDVNKKSRLSSTANIEEDVKEKSDSSPQINEDLNKIKSTPTLVPAETEGEFKAKSSPSDDVKENTKKTRSMRSSLSHTLDDEVKKSEPTPSSFASVFEEDLKKKISTRSSFSHDDENAKKKSSSPNTDNLKKTRSTRSSLSSSYAEDDLKKGVNEDTKRQRSTRSSFSPDFEEVTKKIKSTRSSNIHHDTDHDSKKKRPKHDIEDKKSRVTHGDEKKRTPKKLSAYSDDEGLKKTQSSPVIDKDLKEKCEEFKNSSALPEGMDDVNKSKTAKLSHKADIESSTDINEDLKNKSGKSIEGVFKKKSLKQLASAVNVDENLKKTNIMESSLSLNVDEISKNKTSKLLTCSTVDVVEDLKETTSEPSTFSTNIDEYDKKTPILYDDEGLKKNKSKQSLSNSADDDLENCALKQSSVNIDPKEIRSAISESDFKKEDESSIKTSAKQSTLFDIGTKKGKEKPLPESTKIDKDTKTSTSKKLSSIIDIVDSNNSSPLPEVQSTTLVNTELEAPDKTKPSKKAKSKWISVLNDEEKTEEISKSKEVDKWKKSSSPATEDAKKPKSRWSSIASDTEDINPISSSVSIDTVDDMKKKMKSKWSALSSDEESSKKIIEKSSETKADLTPIDFVQDTNKPVTEGVAKETLSILNDEDTCKKDERVLDDMKKLKSKWSSYSTIKKSTRKTVFEDDNSNPSESTVCVNDDIKKIKSKWLMPENYEDGASKKKSSDEDCKKKVTREITEVSTKLEISPKLSTEADIKKTKKSKWSSISEDCQIETKKKSKLSLDTTETSADNYKQDMLVTENSKMSVLEGSENARKEKEYFDVEKEKSTIKEERKNIVQDTEAKQSKSVNKDNEGKAKNKSKRSTANKDLNITKSIQMEDGDKKDVKTWSLNSGVSDEGAKHKSKETYAESSLNISQDAGKEVTKDPVVDSIERTTSERSISGNAELKPDTVVSQDSPFIDSDIKKTKSRWSSTPGKKEEKVKKKSKRHSVSAVKESSEITKKQETTVDKIVDIQATFSSEATTAKDTHEAKMTCYNDFQNISKMKSKCSADDDKTDTESPLLSPVPKIDEPLISGKHKDDMKTKLKRSSILSEKSSDIFKLNTDDDEKNDEIEAEVHLALPITAKDTKDIKSKRSRRKDYENSTAKKSKILEENDNKNDDQPITPTKDVIRKKSEFSIFGPNEEGIMWPLPSEEGNSSITNIKSASTTVSPVLAKGGTEAISKLSPLTGECDEHSSGKKSIESSMEGDNSKLKVADDNQDLKESKSNWSVASGGCEKAAKKKSKTPFGLTEDDSSKITGGKSDATICSISSVAPNDMKEIKLEQSAILQECSNKILKSSADDAKKEIPAIIPLGAAEDSKKPKSKWTTIATDHKGDTEKKSNLFDEDKSKKVTAEEDGKIQVSTASVLPTTTIKKADFLSPGDYENEDAKNAKKQESLVLDNEDILPKYPVADDCKSMPSSIEESEEINLGENIKKKSKWTYSREESKKRSRWSSTGVDESTKTSKLYSVSGDSSEEVNTKSTSPSISVITEESKLTAKSPTGLRDTIEKSMTQSKLSSVFSDEDLIKTSNWIPVVTDASEESKNISQWSTVTHDASEESINKSKWSPVSTEETNIKSSSASTSSKDSKIRFKWSVSPDRQGGIKKGTKWSTDFNKKRIMPHLSSRSFDFEESEKKTKPIWSSDLPVEADTKEKSKWSVEEDTKSKLTGLDTSKPLTENEGERSGLCLKVSKLKSRLMDKLHESEIELQRPKPKTWIQQKAEERLQKRRLSSKSPRRLSLQSQEISFGKTVDKVEVTINPEDTLESSRINIEEKQIENVPELIDDIIGSVEVKIPIEESKLESILSSPGLPQEDDENSALNTLATISELSSYDLCKTDINIEKNLTVVSESDLGDTQVEIAKIPIIEEGTVKATTVASFSVDFTEDLNVLENKKSIDSKTCLISQDVLEIKDQSLAADGIKMFDQGDGTELMEDKLTETANVLTPRRNSSKFRILEDVAIFEKKEKSVSDNKSTIEDVKELNSEDIDKLGKKTLISKEDVSELEGNTLPVCLEGAAVLEEKDMSVVLEEVIALPTSEGVAVPKDKDKSSLLEGCSIETVDLFENKKATTTLEDLAASETLSPTIQNVDSSKVSIIGDVNKETTTEEMSLKIQDELITKKVDILSNVKLPEASTTAIFRSKKAFLPPKKFAERQFSHKKFVEQSPNSVEMEMAKLTDTSMDTAIVEQPQESTTSTKLLEILTDPKIPKQLSSHTSQLKIANPKFELEATPPTKPKTKLLIRSSLPSSSRTGGKQMIISEKIIKTTKEVHSSPVSVQKTNDTEGIEAFIIHKKETNNDGLKVVKKSATKKPTILDHTIIKPKDETTKPAPQKSDENVFDIDSMPIVLTDQILTPENIDKVPIMIPQDKSNPKVLPGKMKLLNRTPLMKEVSSTRSPHFGKNLKPQKIFQHHSIARQGSAIMNQSKGKMMIVPSEASTSTGSKYTMGKRIVKKIPTTTIIPGSSKLHNVQEPTGNKIMIVTNNQGQQSRVVLTPAQQKMIGYQSPTLKKVAKAGKSANIISQTIINSKGQITTTNQAGVTSTTSSLSQVKRPKIEPSRNKVLGQKLLLQSSLNQLKPGQPRTIIIKNPQGQTVKKIHGTDDALLEKQVQEQIEAINRATWSQGSVKPVPKKYSKKTLTESTKIALQQKAQMITSSGASGSKATNIPPLSPITKKTETQVKPKPVSPKAPPSPSPAQSEPEKGGEKRAPHQLVIQDALGNQTTITEGQILALPSETVDGQPQSYMLVTLDETGNLTPLNNEALMSLDPNLNLGGDLSNMVLQIDQGAMNTEPSAEIPSIPSPPVAQEPKTEEVITAEETEVVSATEPEKLVEDPQHSVDTSEMQTVACAINNGESNQQLIITGDPASTQKFLESLSDGNADLANLLANAEGNILIHADGQQILINTDADNPLLLSMNSDGTSTMESGESSGNPIFSSQAPKNQDILAAALADTDVFQQEQSIISAKVTQSQLSPTGGALYPINVNNVLETSAMSSPIMTPLEVPSTNSKKIDVETDILAQVPKNVDLPITITDPNISQTVAHQQAALMSSDLHTNLDLPLAIQDVTVTSAEMNSPTFTYALPHLDDSVDMQKPFTNSISMPLLTEIADDVATTSSITASTTLPSEIIEVEHDKEILVETSMIPEKIHEETVIEESIAIPEDVKKTDSQYLLATSGLSSISNQMCSSLSEPPPDMFDFTIDQSYDLKQQSMEISPPITESPVDDEFLDTEKTESESEQASFTPQSNSPSTNSTDSCEIPVQPEIVTDISSKSSETELRHFDEDEKM